MKYSPLGSKKMISQTFNGDCLKTTFERENELKSEYEIYVNKFHTVPADPINPSIKETFSNVMISLADLKIETI